MSDDVYSIYEAKTHFSKIMERVRRGESVTISYHGTPIAEIRPLPADKETFEQRYARLVREGVIVPAKNPGAPIKIGKHIPGAFQQFMDDRNE